jgi:hypothetical protein
MDDGLALHFFELELDAGTRSQLLHRYRLRAGHFQNFFPAHTAGALQQGNDLRRFAFLLATTGIVTRVLPKREIVSWLFLAKSLILLAGVAGLEPATPGFGDRCSTN